ncbi:MAG: hypothetical protein LC808_04990 [Actinobacteria bacterium]|nr:hypothetical protein [Actinomycetota bacterium]
MGDPTTPMDSLLEWCSARQHGTRAAFRDAYAWCTGDQRAAAANVGLNALEVLGHVEVDWVGDGDWAITPPTLVLLRDAGGNALAVGARSAGVGERLGASCGRFVGVPQPGGPAAWYVGVSSLDQLHRVASSAGLAVDIDVAGRYVEALPRLADLVDAGRRDFAPGGVEASRFDPETMRFEPFPWHRGPWPPGAYEHRGGGPNTYVLRLEDRTCSVVDRRVAVHHELRRLRLATGDARFLPLDWDQDEGVLYVDRQAPLPLLHARAAILATGRLPETRRLEASPRLGSRRVNAFSGVHILTYKAIANSLDIPIPIGRTHAHPQHQ